MRHIRLIGIAAAPPVALPTNLPEHSLRDSARIIEQESNLIEVEHYHYFAERRQYQNMVKRLQFVRALKGGAAPAHGLAHRIASR